VTPAPGDRPWRSAIVPLFVLDVLTAFTGGMVPPILPLVGEEWRRGEVEAGLVNTSYALGRLAASFPALALRARRGTRATVFLGLGALAVGSVTAGVSGSFPLFLVGRAVMGFGSAGAFLAVFAELLEATPAAWRGRVANGFEALAILSLGTGGVLAAAGAGLGGWRAAFLGAVPVIALAGLVWRRLDPAVGRAVAAPPAGDGRPGVGALLPIFVAGFAQSFTWAGLWTTLAPLLGASAYGLAPAGLGAAMGAGYVAEVVGLLGIALVIDRVRRPPVFLAGAATVAAGSALLAAGGAATAFVGALVLIGAGYAVWMIPATLLADRAGIPLPPRLLAAHRLTMDIGMITGPVLLGAVAQGAGARTAAATAGLALVAGALPLLGPGLYSRR
jgi:MFS family permease